jgi:hypothetical protein
MALAALLMSGSVLAQAPAPSATQVSPWQFFASIGANFGDGSEELVKGTYANTGGTYSIKAGNGFAVAAGVSYSVSDKADVQLSVGHERTSTSGSNGDFAFSKVPVELLGFYNIDDHWRIGGGVRSGTSARLESTGVVSSVGNYDFKSRLGYVLEAQYLTQRNANPLGRFGVAVKLVDETFEYTPTNYTARGHHLGVSLVYYR